ncbi:uncharacterized protein LOC129227613 [Uloborus diversus]|uniref:uncharacterized protein LOC129227613 n=1 Tax=Uloborus diversus TaxID=327109 RepID=UPI0024091323|nr:uncharacterized protein LOC129227613 [Uloborus diversus]
MKSFRNLTPLRGFTVLIVFCSLARSSYASKAASSRQDISKPPTDMVAAESIAVSNYKVQALSSAGDRRYGYPYAIAPTLPPFLKARSDDFENEASDEVEPRVVALSPAKTYGSRIDSKDNGISLKKQKKTKVPYTYGATRRQSYDEDSSSERTFQGYREPKYRNFDELETRFMPRRVDYSVPYSEYAYPKSRRPVVSPRDPYLTPSTVKTDTFYPKVNSYPSTYGKRDPSITYGAGRYEDPNNYHSEHIHGGNYGLGNSYGTGNSYGPSPSKYPSAGGHYEYQEDYAIESNKPIIGDIRKRLLDYAGASDLYEGEPDYLREVARNKHKYGTLGNDFYSYGGYKSSYGDYPYGESKVTIVKKARS